MKKFLSLFALLAVNALVSGTDIVARSVITSVTVYPQSALVTREAVVQLRAGESTVSISDIVPEVDENSLKVAAGDAVRIYGAELKREQVITPVSGQRRSLEQDIEKLNDEKRRVSDAMKLIADEKRFIDTVILFAQRELPKEMNTKMPSGKELGDVYAYISNRLADYYARTFQQEIVMRDIDNKINVLRRTMQESTEGTALVKTSVEIPVYVERAGTYTLALTYQVKSAWWTPVYDVRVDFDTAKVELIAYGVVRQRTGESWSNVSISLSTAKPVTGGRMPYIAPFTLRPREVYVSQDKYRRSMPSAMKSAAPAPAAQTRAFAAKEAEELVAPPPPELSSSAENGIAMTYILNRKSVIDSDGTENKLPIFTENITGAFEYTAYPKAGPQAYLGSRLTNNARQLMPGRANIFLTGGYVGPSSLDGIGPGEGFDLYLGIDDNVKVRREQIEKKMDETFLGMTAATKKMNFKYKITIENYKAKPIKFKLYEPMPVSENDRIKVTLSEPNIAPTQKDWDDRKGVWQWDLTLAVKEKKEITYSFSVEYPREVIVDGL
ncbi:MAG: mucoidy inhibitor MuiA family protein [Spirochaetes bacterium]|nr:mucoidy inhibitor MuiA family protein [Spirochaetota bacterium]